MKGAMKVCRNVAWMETLPTLNFPKPFPFFHCPSGPAVRDFMKIADLDGNLQKISCTLPKGAWDLRAFHPFSDSERKKMRKLETSKTRNLETFMSCRSKLSSYARPMLLMQKIWKDMSCESTRMEWKYESTGMEEKIWIDLRKRKGMKRIEK